MKDMVTITFLGATIGAMFILCSIIFLIYCLVYEIKNKKKLYKEAKIVAVIALIIGIVMVSVALLYLNKNIVLLK
ncbi:hypothetical protein [Terrisporobacter sp.]